jgi:hypothetical protein
VGLSINFESKVFFKIRNFSAFEIKDPESYVESNVTVNYTVVDVLFAEILLLWYRVAAC